MFRLEHPTKLDIKFGKEKMDRVRNRSIFQSYKGTSAESVARAYYKYGRTPRKMTTLDLLTLVEEGNLKYTDRVTKTMLLDLTDRHLRGYIYADRLPFNIIFTERQVKNVELFKQFIKETLTDNEQKENGN